MTNIYNIKEAIDVKFNGKTYSTTRLLCPDCVKATHIQGETDEVYDCKNIFVDNNNRTVGQCCCYSCSHGYRE